MDFTQRIGYVMGVPVTWNNVFDWLFLIASVLALFIAIFLQVMQLIKNREKADK